MHILHEILNGIWAIEKQTADGHLLMVKAMLTGEPLSYNASEERERQRNVGFAFNNAATPYCISDQGLCSAPEDAPENSIAIIEIGGVITKADQFCGPAGMMTKGDLIKRCDANSNIDCILLVLESGGGDGYAARYLNEVITAVEKPIIAFVDDMAASAAYYIASGCDAIFVNSNLARVGSIGTYVTVIDYTEYFKSQGINIIEVYASQSSDKNGDVKAAIDGDIKPLQAMVDKFNENFLAAVKANRGDKLKCEDSAWNTGKVFFADEALQLGLIDGIDTLDNVINNLLN